MAAPAEKTAYFNLVVLLVFSAVPLLLAAAASLMGWAYRRDLLRREHHAPGPEPATEPQSDDMGSQLRLIPADASADLGPAADQVLKDARDVTTGVHFAYLVAALAYAALSTAFLMQAAAKQWRLTVLIISYLILASQIVVVTWFIRMSLRQRLSTFLAYSLIGSLLALLVKGPKRILGLFAVLIKPPNGPLSFLDTPIGLFTICPLAGLYFLLARRMQPFLALLAASLLYIGVGMVPFYLIMSDPGQAFVDAASERPWLILAGLANLVLGVILAGKLLRLLPRSGRVFGLATLAVAVVAIVGYRMPLHGAPLVLAILSGTAGSVLGVLFVWAVFKALVWLQEQGRWLTPEILDAHLCWTYQTLCLLVSAWFLSVNRVLSDFGLLFLGCVATLALHLAVLHTLLWRIRSRRPSRAPKRLLLLRVFGRADEPEYLLDALDDTWRRIGAVDILGRSDVASRTLRSSTLEAFLLRRGADQFLKTDEEVDNRLLDLRSDVEGDARYPVNGVYCYENIWQRAFIHLTQDAAAVLMDLRGFTSDNRSCAWELAYLVKHIPLR